MPAAKGSARTPLGPISMEGIDIDKISRYLGNFLKREEIDHEGFEGLLYTRKVKEKKTKIVKKKIGRKEMKSKMYTKRTKNSKKPTKNPRVIFASSALSFSEKRTILTQECLRRLRNTRVELGPEIQKKHLNQFMLKLKNSGYSQKFRMEILDSAPKAFEKMVEDDKSV